MSKMESATKIEAPLSVIDDFSKYSVWVIFLHSKNGTPLSVINSVRSLKKKPTNLNLKILVGATTTMPNESKTSTLSAIHKTRP